MYHQIYLDKQLNQDKNFTSKELLIKKELNWGVIHTCSTKTHQFKNYVLTIQSIISVTLVSLYDQE
uniref:Uncharacterized protein n=1 Tax=Amphimedon queenslandica TaxID=400682 RepID=A0A1X7UGG8_AMPQE